MTKPESKTIEHREADPVSSLPSMHIDHSSVLANELDVRVIGLDGGIAALVIEMDGMQAQFERDQSNARIKHEADMGARQRLKTDLERARRMAMAARDVYAEEIPTTASQTETAGGA